MAAETDICRLSRKHSAKPLKEPDQSSISVFKISEIFT